MNYLTLGAILVSICWFGAKTGCYCQQQHNANLHTSFPYYLQSPIGLLQPPVITPDSKVLISNEEQQQQQQQQQIHHNNIKLKRPIGSLSRKINGESVLSLATADSQQQQLAKTTNGTTTCLYDKRYFAKLDECLAKKPYPTVGLPAYKNEDLLVNDGQRGSLNGKHGCVFILNNGLFKNYQISRYSLDSDSQCLDGSKVGLSLAFTNVTLSHLWTLRCLNRADQLLDDATLDGKTVDNVSGTSSPDTSSTDNQRGSSVCVGSSQNFGFASLQLTSIEAQVELATDIYKNWRVTNVTVAMVSPAPMSSAGRQLSATQVNGPSTTTTTTTTTDNSTETPTLGTNIKDYVFESLDGDELNWRYLHLFQNWSRNKMHTNFLDQYRRFLWISLQRCLSESSEKLPVKLLDVFATNQRLT